MDLFSPSFTFKKIPLAKQDPDFCHKAIELYILKRKKGASDRNLVELEAHEAAELADVASSMQQLAASSPRGPVVEQHVQQQQMQQQQEELQQQRDEQQLGSDPQQELSSAPKQQHLQQIPQQHGSQQQPDEIACSIQCAGESQTRLLSWSSRRRGVECARLLADVQVPSS
eukprot:GHUV01018498.1.p1 GENE.GHUV01018498.1~~GHUV01018498.1.p1  ORF type:complete len:171 (-),score=61.53 GHUV01018498.1:53-565(-)